MRWRRVLGLLLAPIFVVSIGQAARAAHVALSQDAPRQGQPVEVIATGLGAGEPPSIDFNGNHYKLFPSAEEGVFKALLAIPADLEPGSYKLEIGNDTVPVRV
jgi:hypothetical protein